MVRIYLRAVAVVNQAVVFAARCVARHGVRSQVGVVVPAIATAITWRCPVTAPPLAFLRGRALIICSERAIAHNPAWASLQTTTFRKPPSSLSRPKFAV